MDRVYIISVSGVSFPVGYNLGLQGELGGSGNVREEQNWEGGREDLGNKSSPECLRRVFINKVGDLVIV